ncbi:hypothetical protein [Mycolicibacterium xanthum]|uniref:hypothetical protein n=1 Tax=Mycolicibacterium xanthum TaxID=2796469 RepID=UPI00355811AC
MSSTVRPGARVDVRAPRFAAWVTTVVPAFVAALLNAAFGICPGCRLHPLSTRFSTTS